VAEIKLRNINREYILKRTAETEDLQKAVEELEKTLNSRARIRRIIIDELEGVIKRHGAERRTQIVYADEVEEFDAQDMVEDYPVTLFLSKEGYFKKITPQSLRMSGEHKYKDGDSLSQSFESSNRRELLIFTDKQQIYKVRVSDFEDVKASSLGIYLPTRLKMDEGESVIHMLDPMDYKKDLLIFFQNGKAARIEMAGYETKTNRRRLINAFSDKSPVVKIMLLEEEIELVCRSSDDRTLVFSTSMLQTKTSRTTQGVAVMSLKAKRVLKEVMPLAGSSIQNVSRYRVKTIPAAGALLKTEDREEQQLSLLD